MSRGFSNPLKAGGIIAAQNESSLQLLLGTRHWAWTCIWTHQNERDFGSLFPKGGISGEPPPPSLYTDRVTSPFIDGLQPWTWLLGTWSAAKCGSAGSWRFTVLQMVSFTYVNKMASAHDKYNPSSLTERWVPSARCRSYSTVGNAPSTLLLHCGVMLLSGTYTNRARGSIPCSAWMAFEWDNIIGLE